MTFFGLALIAYLILLFIFLGFSVFVIFRVLELSSEGDKVKLASGIFIICVGCNILISAVLLLFI